MIVFFNPVHESSLQNIVGQSTCKNPSHIPLNKHEAAAALTNCAVHIRMHGQLVLKCDRIWQRVHCLHMMLKHKFHQHSKATTVHVCVIANS